MDVEAACPTSFRVKCPRPSAECGLGCFGFADDGEGSVREVTPGLDRLRRKPAVLRRLPPKRPGPSLRSGVPLALAGHPIPHESLEVEARHPGASLYGREGSLVGRVVARPAGDLPSWVGSRGRCWTGPSSTVRRSCTAPVTPRDRRAAAQARRGHPRRRLHRLDRHGQARPGDLQGERPGPASRGAGSPVRHLIPAGRPEARPGCWRASTGDCR